VEAEPKPEENITKEKAELLRELGKTYDNLKDPEFLKANVQQRLGEDIAPMMEYLFNPGDSFGFEQIIGVEAPDPFEVGGVRVWRNLDDTTREELLGSIGNFFGVKITDRESDSFRNAIKDSIVEEGVKGASSEGGVKVTVLRTNNPGIDIHISEYDNPDLGTQYSLVRSEGEEG
jgi:hypothetical protein